GATGGGDQFGPTPGQPMGMPDAAAAASSGRLESHRLPVKRRPLTLSAAVEQSQRTGGTMTSGRSSALRSRPFSAVTMPVSVGPPGTTTLTVTPLPSSSTAQIADSDSSAALEQP